MKLFGGAGPAAVEIETVIGQNTHVTGKMESDHSIQIDGNVEGDVDSRQTVSIGQTGRVQGNVRAISVAVAGRLEGNVHAETQVQIRSTGQIAGDIEAGSLIVEEGGMLDGRSTMVHRKEKEEALEMRKEERAEHRRR